MGSDFQVLGPQPVLPHWGFQVQKRFQEHSGERCFAIIIFNRCKNRFQASLKLHLGLQKTLEIVILQGM